MATKENDQIQLFKTLDSQLKQEEYEKALETCNKLRSKMPNDPDVVKTKCLCLIRTSQIEKALEIASKYDFLTAQKAYCLYRLKDMSSAIKEINKIPQPRDKSILHLEAQIHYRMNNFEKSIPIYEDLLAKAPIDEDSVELKANLLAAYVAANRDIRNLSDSIPSDNNFEIAYNKACGYLQAGQLEEAEEQLNISEKCCREVLASEGYSESEIESEVAPIVVQKAYLFQLTGNTDKALSMYRSILKSKPSDVMAVAVASNNLVTVREDRDVFDSYKRLKTISLDDSKLSRAQKATIISNHAILLYSMNKGVECREVLKQLEKEYPEFETPIIIQVALYLKEKDFDGCIAWLKSMSQCDTSIVALAHVYALQGNQVEAARLIESVSSLVHKPGTVATLVGLYDSVNQASESIRVLKDALSYYDSNDPESIYALRILEGDAKYKLERGQYEEAANSYTDLVEEKGHLIADAELRLRALASLIVALSYVDVKSAEFRCAMLPPLPSTNITAEELEKYTPKDSRSRVARMLAKVADAEDKKKERKRANRNPERIARKRLRRKEAYLDKLRNSDDYNAFIGLPKPDPERWIPLKQRSHAKRGRRGRNRFVGAQGSGMGTQKDAAKLDAAARAAAKKDLEYVEEKKGVVATGKSTAVQRKSKKKKRRG